MLRFAFFLGFLTLAAGCIVEDKPVTPPGDGGVDSGVDAGGDAGTMCGTLTCPADRPVCNNELVCVQCTVDEASYCTEQGLICDIDASSCIECSGDMDCTDPEAARCDEGLCKPCMQDAECNGVDRVGAEQSACDDGVCVDCTPQTEGTTCVGGMACHPVTKECTNVRVGSLEVCEECVSDSQCGDEESASDAHLCVPMFYELPDQRFPDDETGFCLKSIELGGMCMNPFRIPLTRTSLSGAEADDYCGINEDLATCPAVRALLKDRDCSPANGDADCPQPSGLCRELPGMTNTCTYLCSDPVECKNSPVPGSTCGSSGSGGDAYCGG